MIAALLAFQSSAFAGSPAIDLLLKPITAQSRPVVAYTETLDIYGQAQTLNLSPREGGLGNRGLLVELSQGDEPVPWVLSTGWSHARTRYTFNGLTFAPTTMDMHLTGGILPWFHQQETPVMDGYMSLLAGVRAETLSAAPIAPTSVAFAPMLSLGMGVASRRLPARLRVEGRVDLVAHFNPGDGRVELPRQALVWKWYPASAAASLLIGGGFGGKGSSAPDPG